MSFIALLIPSRHRRSLFITVAALTALALIACNDSDNGDDATPSAGGGGGMELDTAQPARLYAPEATDQAGAVSAGDFNGDGLTDVALAAAFADGPGNSRPDAGEAYIFLGPLEPGDVRDAATGGQALTIYGAAAGDQMGRSIAAGDFNGDGIDDLILGSPFGDPYSRTDAGGVDVILGSSDIGAGEALRDLADGANVTIAGASPGDLVGISVASAKLNGDQAADLLIGAFWASGPGDTRPMAGEVYAIFGSPDIPMLRDLASAPADITVYGAAAEDRLGEGVAAGDVNGDGTEDLVLPAPFAASPGGAQDAGRTYVIVSPAPPEVDLASFEPLATVYGADDGDQLGHVPVAADFNGDGKDDLLLTAVSADGPANSIDLAGEAALIPADGLAGDINGVPGEAGAIIYGEGVEHRLGRSAGAADVDGDGSDELLLGAPGAPSWDGKAIAGRMYVLAEGGLPEEVHLPAGARVYYGEDAGDSLASEVYARLPLQGEDMNGDGKEEVLVVTPLGDGPENTRRDCGEALILFITPASTR